MGGGRAGFESGLAASKYGCMRSDGRNLTREWLGLGGGKRSFVGTRAELDSLDVDGADFLLGETRERRGKFGSKYVN